MWCRTFDRTRRFIADGLNWRGAARPYALVVWGLLAGLVWLVVDAFMLSGAGSTASGSLLLKLCLLATLTVVAAIDARFGIIPDSLSLLLLVTGTLNVLLENALEPLMLAAASGEQSAGMAGFDAISWRVLEALTAVFAAMLLRACYRMLRSRDGFGLGDVKFVGAATLWVGLPMVPLMLMVAVSSAFGTILLLRNQGRDLDGGEAIPFGPHLALGLWLTVLLGSTLGL